MSVKTPGFIYLHICRLRMPTSVYAWLCVVCEIERYTSGGRAISFMMVYLVIFQKWSIQFSQCPLGSMYIKGACHKGAQHMLACFLLKRSQFETHYAGINWHRDCMNFSNVCYFYNTAHDVALKQLQNLLVSTGIIISWPSFLHESCHQE